MRRGPEIYCGWIFLILLVFLSGGGLAHSQEISVRAAVEKQAVFAGEPFLFQIQIEGDDAPSEPDLSSLADFAVQARGGQHNSGTSITIINGKVEKITRKGYVFNFSLTPKRAGRLAIPSVKVIAGGKDFYTDPIVIQAREPEETDDFKLRMELSKNTCYVGEPVILTATWYIGKNVKGVEFDIPVMNDQRFTVDAPLEEPPGQNDFRIPVGGGEVIGRRGEAVLDGRNFMTLQFSRILIPRQAGNYILPQATVRSQALAGYSNKSSRQPFDVFNDDFFGFGRREVYTTVITPSNEPELKVLSLPEKGRPLNFSGLVGKYGIAANAEPQEVNVGDPVTLTIQIAGPYLKNFDYPPLTQHPEFAGNFKIPAERSPGETDGLIKTFTRTIRARHPDVREIPSLSLAFFNTETGQYEIAETGAIPLKVMATRIVTALDAEGKGPDAGIEKLEVRVRKGGIAHNYEGADVLISVDPFVSGLKPGWGLIYLFLLPPVFYFLLLAGRAVIVSRSGNAQQIRARKAYGKLLRELKSVEPGCRDKISESCTAALMNYLADRLGLSSGTLTFHDVDGLLSQQGVSGETLDALRNLFELIEAARYAAGGVENGNSVSYAAKIEKVAASIERSFKK